MSPSLAVGVSASLRPLRYSQSRHTPVWHSALHFLHFIFFVGSRRTAAPQFGNRSC
jgi:hypothetical protein